MPEIGLMGGSFNPIHRWPRRRLLRAALNSGKVERVLFLPIWQPAAQRGKGWPINLTVCAWWSWP